MLWSTVFIAKCRVLPCPSLLSLQCLRVGLNSQCDHIFVDRSKPSDFGANGIFLNADSINAIAWYHKKLLVTSASLLVTSALLVVTRSYMFRIV